MSHPAGYLALDLGAESGRGVVGRLSGGRLAVREVHRFETRVVRRESGLHWDVHALWDEVRVAIGRAASEFGLASLGIDAWGVDFGLLGSDGALLDLPHTYRDRRTEGAVESLLARMPRAEVYGRTGVQILPINTLFQLHALARAGSPLLDTATHLLFIPDLFHFWLTGRLANEFTVATTSQILNPETGGWDEALAEAAGFPPRLLQAIVAPGTALGPMARAVREATGSSAAVVAVGTHDTASAVAAVPAADPGFVYISSGTWSLVGAESPRPIVTATSERANFTNEGGVGHRYRVLKNVMGLWLLQGCRRQWGLSSREAYADLVAAAAAAPPLRALVNPDHPALFNPDDMVEALVRRLASSGEPQPTTRGALVRCVLESLALAYRRVLDQLAEVRGRRATILHVVGGGANNALLCQFTADATGLPVVAGPVEATAVGNILVQALADGAIDSLEAGRDLVRRSFDLERFEPRDRGPWDAAYRRFLEIAEEPSS